jgi:uncharacterized protein YqgC (DUF456 family)
VDPNLLVAVYVLIALILLVGAVTLVIPVLPGLVIIWAATLLYGLVTGFTLPGIILFALITLIMLAGTIIDYLVVGASVRQTGTSWLAIGLALLAGILGTIFLPPLGGLLAALMVLFLVELIRLKDWRKALQSARGMILGLGWSTLARIGFGLTMILLWLLWAFVFKG